MIGRSESIQSVFELIRIASGVDRTVLITGESGCGKELIAKAIHHNSARRDQPLVVVDCSSLSEHILESELFGHRRGAFTGASTDKTGAFEEAHSGTIFLDEISDASKSMQQKLRRVLQEGEIRRVGENELRKVDVRVICATNKNLSQVVEKGEFIRDLYFRINKFPIHVPPLRERREDISLLVDHFLELAAKTSRKTIRRIDPKALETLVEQDWSENNVRELRNTVELAVDFCSGDEITPEVLERVRHVQQGTNATPRPTASAAGRDQGGIVHLDRPLLRDLLAAAKENSETATAKEDTPFYRLQLEFTARAIIEGLRACRWKLRPAAKLLGISPTKLRYEFRDFIEKTLVAQRGNLEDAAEALEIPANVLAKKTKDLGITITETDEP